MPRGYKRRLFFIDKSFQTKFIVKFCIIVVMLSWVIGGTIFFISQDSTTVAIRNEKIIVKPTVDFIMPVLIETLAVVTFFSGMVVLVMTLLTSHRIAGPAYRLKREVNLLKKGNLKRSFKIRTNDQLQDLASSLEEMSNILCQRHVELKQSFGRLQRVLTESESSSGADHKNQVLKTLKDLEKALEYFKT